VTVLVIVKGEQWVGYVHTCAVLGLGYAHGAVDVGKIGAVGNFQTKELWPGKFRRLRADGLAELVVFNTTPDLTRDKPVTTTVGPDWRMVSVIMTVTSTSGHAVETREVENSVVVHSFEFQSL
jgi:hypothetical protein